MYLSRLEAFGFKSFAQKLDMAFDKGLTAVVGPNGCGKTNIVDAIRWVLGEQRPHALRSDTMEDVIFGGTEKRKPMGMAEVSLTILNTDRFLPIDYGEVTATRRLFRSGESEYLLNKTPCRLMDITHLFMDTGIGSHSYSIIELAMMDAILSETPEDRRHLFDEAAGITKYKVRRKSTLQKLALVQQDVLRVNDIILEVETKTSALKRQMRRARRYQEYKDQITALEVEYGRQQFAELCQEASPIAERIDQLKAEAANQAANLSAKEAVIERLRLDLTERESRLGDFVKSSDESLTAVHQTEEHIAILGERTEARTQLVARCQADIAGYQQRLASAQKEHRKIQDQLAETAKALETCQSRLSDRQEKLQQFEHTLETQRAAVEGARTQLVQCLELCSASQADLEKHRTEHRHWSSRLAKVEGDTKAVSRKLGAVEERLAVNAQEVEQIQGQIAEYNALRDENQSALKDVEQKAAELASKQQDLKRQIDARRAELEVLRKVKALYEGYPSGVRKLLLESPLAQGMLGALADLIDADDRYVSALQAALGPYRHAVVVDTWDTARKALGFLSEKAEGRAILLPLDSIARSRPESFSLPGDTGAVRAADLVRCSDGLTGLVECLLGHTFVVDDLDTAFALRPQLPGVQIVTCAGEVLGPVGEVIGGKGREATALIGRQRQISALEVAVQSHTAQLAEVTQRLQEALSVAQDLRDRLSRLDEQISDAGQRFASLDKERAQRQVEQQTLAASSSALQEEQKEIRNTIQALQDATSQQEDQVKELLAQRDELTSRIETEAEGLRFHEKEHQARAGIVQQLSLEATSLGAKRDSLHQEARRLERSCSEPTEGLERGQKEIEGAQKAIQDLRAQQQQAEEELERRQEHRAGLEAQRDEQRAQCDRLRDEALAHENDLRAIRKSQEQLQAEQQSSELKLSELRVKASDLRDHLRKQYGIDVERMDLEETPQDFDAPQASQAIADLERRISRLGPINMAAIEEYEKEKARLDFLTSQRDDLVQAENSLKATIAEINRTARRRFTDTFEQIRANFGTTFARFFGQGQASLQMVGHDDPLEADVEIAAHPEGKTLKNISLLSGGEKALTAIALLLAIYLVKPSPFCVLDEVDAPLDDANLARFLRVLKEFARSTQFIVVTHNRKTMEAAESLYGVTMEEAGVSRLVSVRLAGDGQDPKLFT